jgi:phage I-like protein
MHRQQTDGHTVNKHQSRICVAALSLALAGAGQAAPTAMRILPAGAFKAVDGRPGKTSSTGNWHLTAELARKVIDAVAAQRTDVLVDYEHQSLLTKDNGQPAPASGWLKNLEWRDGPDDEAGLWATDVTWTARAKAAIEANEYRYLSPVFAYDAQGRVLRLDSVALTNNPALDVLDPLTQRAALSRMQFDFQPALEGETMTPEQIAALTQERDTAKTSLAALTTQVATLTTERDTAATQLAALKAEADKAKAETDKAAHATLLTAALTDGRLTPAQKPWAEKQPLAALTEFLDSATAVADLTRRQANPGDAGNADGLSTEELAMCTRMGVAPADFAKAKG